MKKVIILLVAVVVFLIGLVTFFVLNRGGENDPTPIEPENNLTEVETTPEEVDDGLTVIGTSTEGRTITAYHYGEGEKEVVFVGGIHGGYSWNTAAVAYELMEYLENDPEAVPAGVRVTVIPVLNPDGLAEVVDAEGPFEPEDITATDEEKISSRFNANDVDINRNFDCDWQSTSTWQSRNVSGGSRAFSEPEAAAFRDMIDDMDPAAVVVWYSAAGGVFASSCHNDVLSETTELTNLFAEAAGYRAYEEFDFYEITGDMVNWLAKERIPAISVLLTNHTDVEWEKNRAGVEAVLNYYADQDGE